MAVVGIIACPATLLLISGQFDLSVGSGVGFAGMLMAVAALAPGTGGVDLPFALNLQISSAFIVAVIGTLVIGLINGLSVTVIGINALITRILLLLSLAWIVRLTAPLFAVAGHEVSGRDLILLLGGLFLIGKATHEIHERLEGEREHAGPAVPASFTSVIVQIMLLDVVFSLDSVITAVGMADQIAVMVLAVIIAVGIMLLAADAISDFVNRRPTVKMLALAFLILIGTSLMAEGLHQHIPKGYIYFAMAFSVLV